MAFSLSGSTVTVSGANETIATAFAASFNSPSGDNGTYISRVLIYDGTTDVYRYAITNINFIVNGVSFDLTGSTFETIFLATCPLPVIRLQSSGSVRIIDQITRNSVTINQNVRRVIFQGRPTNNGGNDFTTQSVLSAIINQSGGTFYQRGGILETSLVVRFDRLFETAAGIPDIQDGIWILRENHTGASSNSTVFGFGPSSSVGSIGNWKVFANFDANVYFANIASVSGYLPFGSGAGWGYLDAYVKQRILSFQTSGATADTWLWNHNQLELIDPVAGNSVNVAVRPTGTLRTGYVEIKLRHSPTITDNNLAAIQSVEFYAADLISSGSRPAAGSYTNTNSVSVSYPGTGTLTYLATSNSSGQFATPVDILVGTKYRQTDGSTVLFDSRITGAGILLRYRRYGYFFEDSRQTSSTIKPSQLVRLRTNSFVLAASSALALAVTNPTTANQIYDHSQATYATAAYMQYDEVITTADGLTLNLACNVLINSGLSAIAYTPATPAISISAATNGTFTKLQLGAGRTLDLAQNGTQPGAWAIPATGVVTVADGATNLTAFTFASGAQINLRSGATAATVTVASTTGITAGAGVTLVLPSVFLSAPNLPSGTHYLVRYADGNLAELAIGTVSGSGLTYSLPTANNRLIELLAVKVTSSPLYASELFRFTFRNTGVSVSAEEGLIEYPFYSQFGLDGLNSSITSKFAFDNPNLQVDATEVDGLISAKEVHAFAWGQLQTNDAALRLGYVPIEAFTAVGYVIRNGWQVQNQSTTTPLLMTDGYYVNENGDFYNPCAPAIGGKQSTSVFFEPSHTLTIEGSGSQVQVPMLR